MARATKKAAAKRKSRAVEHKTEALFIRVTPAELELIRQAAGPYPAATWGRAELVKLAERIVKEGK